MNGTLLLTTLVCCLLAVPAISGNAPERNPVRNITEGPSVLLIGLGPAGLSFLHALASKRKQLREAGDLEGLRFLPKVTAVERASVPGGIWREHKNKGDDEYRNMYGDLWTNHPKETFEFPDYTFADHFGKEFPPFLRREHVLDYILSRVTRLENIFETNDVYFRTEAKNVRYNKQKGHFVVTLNHWEEDESSGNAASKIWTKSFTRNFDKVVWNGGWNGIPRYPKELTAALDRGDYKGIRVHSLQVDSIPNDAIKNKKIVLIGDNDSANDIAYQMLKRGADKVVVASRSNAGSASLLPSWPENRVEILRRYELQGVTNDGNGLLFATKDVPPKNVELLDVSVVILCTGYDPNVESLSPDLAFALQHLWYLPGELAVPSSYKRHEFDSDFWYMEDDWRMPHNVLTDELTVLNGGKKHIYPDLGKAYGSYISNKYVYRNVFMYNTNMFFNHEATYQQLFDIDVSAWLILGYITGEVPIPDRTTMEERNMEDLVVQMENPNNRYHLDRKYATLLDQLREDRDHWFAHGRDRRKRELYRAEFEVQVRFLARDMHDAKYPASYGNLTHLNQIGTDLVEMSVDFYHNKYWIGHAEEGRNLHNPARGWTYRDMDCSTYKSLYSGNISKPFSGHWLDVDNQGCLANDSPDCGIPRVLKSWDGAFPVRSSPSGLNVTDDTCDDDGITSLFASFEDVEIFNLAVMVVLVIVFITSSLGIAFAVDSIERLNSSIIIAAQNNSNNDGDHVSENESLQSTDLVDTSFEDSDSEEDSDGSHSPNSESDNGSSEDESSNRDTQEYSAKKYGETKPQNAPKSLRLRSIDVLRGLCVFDMMFIHFGEFLSAQWFNQCSLFGLPSFLLVAGISFHVLSESKRRKGEGVSRRAFQRAIFLYLLTATQSLVLHGSITEVYSCETLMMAGHSQLILAALHRVQVPYLVLLGMIIIKKTAVLRVTQTDFYEYWELEEFDDSVSYEPLTYGLNAEDILRFHLFDGVFPLFPCAAYPIFGLAIGKLVYQPLDQANSVSRNLKFIAVAGSIILASGVALLATGKLAPSLIEKSLLNGVFIGAWRSWPYETLEHILVSFGRSLLYVVVAMRVFDGEFTESKQPSWKKSVHNFFSLYGRFSLTLFSLHHVAICGIVGIASYRTGKNYDDMFENVFDLKTSLVLGSAFLLLAHRLCLWMERESIPTLEHLQRLFCSQKATVSPAAGASKKID